jgi:hypothetical protein
MFEMLLNLTFIVADLSLTVFVPRLLSDSVFFGYQNVIGIIGHNFSFFACGYCQFAVMANS